jgi:hypothetical protein
VESQSALGAALMWSLIFLATLAGASLGIRFKVFILIPTIGFILIIILAHGFARGTSVWGVLIAAIVASSCLQVGYIFSFSIRHSADSARSKRSA